MTSNIDRFKADLERLRNSGNALYHALLAEHVPDQFAAAIKAAGEKKVKAYISSLPQFKDGYQAWYSEAHAVIKQLLPDRLADFVRHYEKPKSRKEISYENYRIEDGLQGLSVTRGYYKDKVVGGEAAIPHMQQQLAILTAAQARFASSLYEIKQLVMADLLDSELDAADVLLKNGFRRAAGAVAGVVLEKHLSQVCSNHSVVIRKKNPGIGDLNDALKSAGTYDVPQWRAIQYLADLRNLCDHDKKQEPTQDQVNDLVAGTAKVIKNVS